jgi:hypothetical protein
MNTFTASGGSPWQCIQRVDKRQESNITNNPSALKQSSHSNCARGFCNEGLATECVALHLAVINKVRKSVKNAVFWDEASCGSCKHRRFEGTSVFTTIWRHILKSYISKSKSDYVVSSCRSVMRIVALFFSMLGRHVLLSLQSRNKLSK